MTDYYLEKIDNIRLIKCKICNVYFFSYRDFEEHEKSYSHYKNKKLLYNT